MIPVLFACLIIFLTLFGIRKYNGADKGVKRFWGLKAQSLLGSYNLNHEKREGKACWGIYFRFPSVKNTYILVYGGRLDGFKFFLIILLNLGKKLLKSDSELFKSSTQPSFLVLQQKF